MYVTLVLQPVHSFTPSHTQHSKKLQTKKNKRQIIVSDEERAVQVRMKGKRYENVQANKTMSRRLQSLT